MASGTGNVPQELRLARTGDPGNDWHAAQEWQSLLCCADWHFSACWRWDSGMSGCGGGSSTPATVAPQATTYDLTVTGTFTSGSTTLTHNAKLTLVVQ